MAHLFQNLINTIANALKAASAVTDILHEGANGVKSGFDLSVNDYTHTPRPFMNVTAGRSVRAGRFPSKLTFKVAIVVEFIEDMSAATNLSTYMANLDKIDTALEALALDSLDYSGDKAIPSDDEEDAYSTDIETLEKPGLRITTILMGYQYHKYRS